MHNLLIAGIVLAVFATGCGEAANGGPDATHHDAHHGADEADADADKAVQFSTLRVPVDFSTIQAAVDSAAEGDLILIGPGIYHESVVIDTANLVLRGEDRNTVILDGEHDVTRRSGITSRADGVAVENMTVRNYAFAGVFFTGDHETDFVLHGYRASYLTVYNNRKWGIYAFNAEYGLIENSLTSGHSGAGYYIGQCQPCNALVRDVEAVSNTLAYSGTNAGGNLHIVSSEFHHNRVGLVPNTFDHEALAPQHDAVFAGNYIHHNGDPATPRGSDLWEEVYGSGVVLLGASGNSVINNLIVNNGGAGLAISWLADRNVWPAQDNVARGNVITGNSTDVMLAVLDGDDASGNCFADNLIETSLPANLQSIAPCGGDAGAATISDFAVMPFAPAPSPTAFVPYRDMPEPGRRVGMTDALTVAPHSADRLPAVDDFELAAVVLPEP